MKKKSEEEQGKQKVIFGNLRNFREATSTSI